MNRPFSAFGVLLSLLALTMFAVSSTSRSTTVKPAGERAKRAATRRPVGYPHFELAVAADQEGKDEGVCVPQEKVQAASTEAVPVVQEETQGSGDQALVTEVLLQGEASKLAPVQIEVIEDEGAANLLDSGGRSLYDAVYDWVVYGSLVLPIQESPRLTVVEEPVRELSDVEMTGLFQSFLSAGQENAIRTTERPNQPGTEAGSLRTGVIVPALQNWVRHHVEGFGQAAQNETVAWSDYAELVDSAQQLQATNDVVASISVAE